MSASKFSREFRQRAVETVDNIRPQYNSWTKACKAMALTLGVSNKTVAKWWYKSKVGL